MGTPQQHLVQVVDNRQQLSCGMPGQHGDDLFQPLSCPVFTAARTGELGFPRLPATATATDMDTPHADGDRHYTR
jgi:hypothetical protein